MATEDTASVIDIEKTTGNPDKTAVPIPKSSCIRKTKEDESVSLMMLKEGMDSLRKLVLDQHQEVLARLSILEENLKTPRQEKSSFFRPEYGIKVKPIFGTKRKLQDNATHLDVKKAKLDASCSQQSEDEGGVQKSDQKLEIQFRLPAFGITQPLSERDMKEAISRTLWSTFEEEPTTTAALLIHTLNNDKTKVQNCVQALVKLIDNIIKHPSDPAHLKIHQKSEMYQKNLNDVTGVKQFLSAAGFEEDKEEECYKIDPDIAQGVEFLKMMRDTLMNTIPLSPVLERNTKLYYWNNSASTLKVSDFCKRVVSDSFLDEEAKDEQKPRYLYCCIRVFFPDGYLLQGVFRTSETSSRLYEFVRENLLDDSNSFSLTTEGGLMLREQDHVTLQELLLVPEAVLNLSWGPDFLRNTSDHNDIYLKPEVLARIEFL